MGCLQSQDDIDKSKPLLDAKTDKNDTNASTIESALKASDEPKTVNDDNGDQKSESLIEKTSVLPGELVFDLSFDLAKDLELLQAKYSNKYQPLFDRKMVSVGPADIVSIEANSIKIMQFKLSVCVRNVYKVQSVNKPK